MNDLIKIDGNNFPLVSQEYKGMLQHIQESMPAITKDTSNFHKSHSQYMTTLLDITAITPIRRIKHILAEINKTKMALEEAYINQSKSDIELRRKEEEHFRVKNSFDRELLELEILEAKLHKENGKNAIQGAIRKLSYLVTQYNEVLAKLGKDHITEEEYEKEEEKFHIMTAMKQALCAARARGGIIDEGNHIYLFDMGINGAVAQKEVLAFLEMEQQLLQQGKEPNNAHVMLWLEAVSNKFLGSGKKKTEDFGFLLFDEKSLVKSE